MPADWLSLGGQTEILRRLAMQRERQADAKANATLLEAREYAALAELGTSPSGQIFLEMLVREVLLRPCMSEVDQGRQHVVLQILHKMTEAIAKRDRPEEHIHYEFPLGGFDPTDRG